MEATECSSPQHLKPSVCADGEKFAKKTLPSSPFQKQAGVFHLSSWLGKGRVGRGGEGRLESSEKAEVSTAGTKGSKKRSIYC